jgi:hypothetical protein
MRQLSHLDQTPNMFADRLHCSDQFVHAAKLVSFRVDTAVCKPEKQPPCLEKILTIGGSTGPLQAVFSIP